MTKKYDGIPRLIPEAEAAQAQQCLRVFGHYRHYREAAFASHWEEVAELVIPTSRNTFFYGAANTPGEKKSQRQVDATGMMALERFAAICDSLLTPRNMKWHMLGAEAEYLLKDYNTRLWYEEVTNLLFRYRYAPTANFAGQNQNVYHSLGAFGTASMAVDKFRGGERGLRYTALPLGETYFGQNQQGIIDRMFRHFRFTAEQAEEKWPGSLPECMWKALENGDQKRFDFLHWVCPRDDSSYDPERIDARGKRFSSLYISVDGKCLMGEEGGFNVFPAPASRYVQTPNEVYGRGPAMFVLPSLKTLNAEKRTFLKQGHRAADPVLLTLDDGLVDFSLRPGALNKGGWSADGKPLVGVLPTGEIQISKEMMQEERQLINDAFLVTLFQILTETPAMTATEVIERTNEKGILLAPTVGRQQSEYLGPMIDRELDVLAEQRLLPPMPPLLKEAGGDYSVTYTSPLSRAMRAQEAAGFMRSLEVSKSLVDTTQDASHLDIYDLDTAQREIAEINAVPFKWMASGQAVAQKREARAKVQAEQMKTQQMPAQAAMLKAAATVEGRA